MNEECWKKIYSINKERFYYINKESGQSQWGIPVTKYEKPLPIGWERHKSTTTDYMYYENLETKIRQWDFPKSPIVVPDGWEKKISNLCKQVYYINKRTNKSQWEYPKPLKTVCVELVGDSILDNSYWNDVKTDNTAEILRRMNINVVDRSTEEVYTDRMLDALKLDKGIKVNYSYISYRNNINIPYDMTDDDLVNPNPTDSDIWNKTPKNNRFIVLSLGGNDVALHKKFFIPDIISKIKEVITRLLTETKISPRHFAYLIPYTPSLIMEKQMEENDLDPKEFYKNMVFLANKMCKELDIHCISLSHFTDKEKYGEFIPEPTKKGAKDIADLIIKWIEEAK
jgi:hypothetical protein